MSLSVIKVLTGVITFTIKVGHTARLSELEALESDTIIGGDGWSFMDKRLCS